MAGRAPWRVPNALALLLNLPVLVALVFFVIHFGVRLSGGGDLIEGSGWAWFGLAAAPGAVLDLLAVSGRLSWVDALPDPVSLEAPPPPSLALPGSAGGAMRPAAPAPKAVPGRRSVDGLLFAAGLAAVAAAVTLMLVEQQSFDSVLGIKLGGVWLAGTYWNRWWFVFYGLLAAGGALVSASMALFIRRLNRRQE